MIVTATISSVLIEASGTPEECETFLRAMIDFPKLNRWWLPDPTPNVCNPFKAHFGTCGAADCPIGADGKMKIVKVTAT